MVEKLKIDINSIDKQGNTTLMGAVAFMSSNIIKDVLCDKVKELTKDDASKFMKTLKKKNQTKKVL